MLTIILLSIGVPILTGIGYLIMRDGRPQFLTDVRGIALQTVIVIVVLLAIAGTVAGVLLTRGEAEIERLGRDPAIPARTLTQINALTDPTEKELACRQNNFAWNSATNTCS